MSNLIPDEDPVEYNDDEDLAVLPDDDLDVPVLPDDERPLDEADFDSDTISPQDL